MPKLQIPNKLEPFVRKKKRFKIAFGGRGAAKSQSFANILLMKSQTEAAKVGCFREMQNSIEDSVHSLLSSQIDNLGLEGFTVEKATIYNDQGGEFRFKGLSRNPDAVKSMHGFRYFWDEEGQSISRESLKKQTPTLREQDAELWVSMNPESSEDPMSQRFIVPYYDELLKHGYYEDDLHLITWINYYDNPWFPEALEQERRWDYDNLDRAEYDHIWLGHFNDSVENSIIRTEWFDAAIDAHIKLGFEPRGIKVVTHDPSDSGDPRALASRHGSVVLDVQENDKDDVNDACDWALDYAIENKADLFRWDCDGLGLTLKRQVNSSLTGKRIKWQSFFGSNGCEKPDSLYEYIVGEKEPKKNRQVWKNMRAQCYGRLRDRFYLTYRAVKYGRYIDPDKLISISSKIENKQKLRAEVCRIPKKHNGAGLFQIMSKEEIRRKYKIKSANMADCLMMGEMTPEEENKDFFKPIPVKPRGIV